jgi:hypothetical protein
LLKQQPPRHIGVKTAAVVDAAAIRNMSEATAVCRLGQQVLEQQHKDHPHFFKIGLPGIQVRGAATASRGLHTCMGHVNLKAGILGS